MKVTVRRLDDVWCVSCQRWLRETETTHTCYDAQPTLYFGTVGAGVKWHIGNQEKPLALCTLGTFQPLLLANSEVCTASTVPPLCKNCARRWRRWREYKDFL